MENKIVSKSLNLLHLLENKVLHIKENEIENPHLSKYEISFFHTVLSENPTIFNKINETINEILQQNENIHDLKDVLKIVHHISSVYTEIFDPKEIDIISCIKFTVDGILDSGLLPFPNIEIMFVKKVVDASLDLLKINLPVVKETIKETIELVSETKTNEKDKRCFCFF